MVNKVSTLSYSRGGILGFYSVALVLPTVVTCFPASRRNILRAASEVVKVATSEAVRLLLRVAFTSSTLQCMNVVVYIWHRVRVFSLSFQ